MLVRQTGAVGACRIAGFVIAAGLGCHAVAIASVVQALIVALSEYEFARLLAWLRDDALLPWARGMVGTTVTDEGFQRLRRRETAAENGKVSRASRWAHMLQGTLLEYYDRKPPRAPHLFFAAHG
jgi:hypothetical protein